MTFISCQHFHNSIPAGIMPIVTERVTKSATHPGRCGFDFGGITIDVDDVVWQWLKKICCCLLFLLDPCCFIFLHLPTTVSIDASKQGRVVCACVFPLLLQLITIHRTPTTNTNQHQPPTPTNTNHQHQPTPTTNTNFRMLLLFLVSDAGKRTNLSF